ncbi:MAG: ABC transporter permease [Mycobacteriales bacterium]
MSIVTSQVDAGTAAAGLTTRRRGLGFIRILLSNGKATVGAVLLLIFCFVAAFPGVFTDDDPRADAYDRSMGLSSHHLLGTTAYGQDLWAQVIYGTRQSLVIAAVAGALATAISVIVGVAAGYLAGVADNVLSLLIDVFLVIPTFPLIIVIAAYKKSSLTVLIAVLVLTGWSYGARQMRVQTMSLRNRDFLQAARARGERRLYVIVVEVLPTMTSLIVAQFLGAALYSVLAAAGLQFIGLGDPNALSWGTILYFAENNEALQTNQYAWAVAPGVCIALLGAAFALLNYAFDEVSNPALRPVRRRGRRGVAGS